MEDSKVFKWTFRTAYALLFITAFLGVFKVMGVIEVPWLVVLLPFFASAVWVLLIYIIGIYITEMFVFLDSAKRKIDKR